MSVLKGLNFTTVARAASTTPEQLRRNKLITHLHEQIAMARADMEGNSFSVKKRRWEHNGNIVLTVRWGAKPMEFEKGKSGIVLGDMADLVSMLDKLIAATQAGELDDIIARMNKQRTMPKRKAA